MILLTGRQRQKMQSNLTTERRAATNNVLLLMQVRIKGDFSASNPHE